MSVDGGHLGSAPGGTVDNGGFLRAGRVRDRTGVERRLRGGVLFTKTIVESRQVDGALPLLRAQADEEIQTECAADLSPKKLIAP